MRALAAAAIIQFLLCPGAAALAAAPGAPVRVFDTGELTLARYTVLERLWTGTWRASAWLPQYQDAAQAISALTAEAAELGADGVTNLHCVRDRGGFDAGYNCYGLAIKLRQ